MEEVRIWMTGAGLVTALGANTRATWDGLIRGERGFRAVDLFDVAGQRSKIAATVQGLDLPDHSGAWSRTSVFARKAAEEALTEAGIDPKTKRMQTRLVNVKGEGYEVARRYMIRLEKHDFSDDRRLEKLAAAAAMTMDQFRQRFGYLVEKE